MFQTVLKHAGDVLKRVQELAQEEIEEYNHVEGRARYSALASSPFVKWLELKKSSNFMKSKRKRKRKFMVKGKKRHVSEKSPTVTMTRLISQIWEARIRPFPFIVRPNGPKPSRLYDSLPEGAFGRFKKKKAQLGVDVFATVKLETVIAKGERPPVRKNYCMTEDGELKYNANATEGFYLDEFADPVKVTYYRIAKVKPQNTETEMVIQGDGEERSFVKFYDHVMCDKERLNNAGLRFWSIQQLFKVEESLVEEGADSEFALVRLYLHGASTPLKDAARADELFVTFHTTVVPLRWVASIENVVEHPHAHLPDNAHTRRAEDLTLSMKHADDLKKTIDPSRGESPYGGGYWPETFYYRKTYDPENGGYFRLPDHLSPRVVRGKMQECPGREEMLRRRREKQWTFLQGKLTKGCLQCNVGDFVLVLPEHVSRGGLGHQSEATGALAVCKIVRFRVRPRAADVKVLVHVLYRAADLVATPQERRRAASARSALELYWCDDRKEEIPVESIVRPCHVYDKRNVDGSCFFCRQSVFRHANRQKWKLIKKVPPEAGLAKLRDSVACPSPVQQTPLHVLDLFAGAGGMAEGLRQSKAGICKWAVENCPWAAEAFKSNFPEAAVYAMDCNVLLRQIMHDQDNGHDCVSDEVCDAEAAKLFSQGGEEMRSQLPKQGEVDMTVGGTPCQGYSGLNRFPLGEASLMKNSMLVTFASYIEYLRPPKVLFENVITLAYNVQFRQLLRALLEMNYQVKFCVLQAAHFGCPQGRRRLFLWAGSPQEDMPAWPVPTHTFSSNGLGLELAADDGMKTCRAYGSRPAAAPLPCVTVKDATSDLPPIGPGKETDPLRMQYAGDPFSPFQEEMRAPKVGPRPTLEDEVLYDHRSRKLSIADTIRCSLIPKGAGCDWHALLDSNDDAQFEVDGLDVHLKNGVLSGEGMGTRSCPLVPKYLTDDNSASRGYERLSPNGCFPTIVTNPSPSGTIANVLAPDQPRVFSIREAARAQSLPDFFQLRGSVAERYKQVGNAVPPFLARALFQELLRIKCTTLI